ncbi:MAG: hypothetical protein ACHBNF_19870, partial [Chromatiales bacterium]
MQAANERYLSFMASIDNPNAGTPSTAKPVREHSPSESTLSCLLSVRPPHDTLCILAQDFMDKGLIRF